MGQIKKFINEKMLIGVLASDTAYLKPLEERLLREFGRIDYRSGILNFDFTDYYRREMGPELKRIFFGFAKLIDPSLLSEIKIKTNEIENSFLNDGKRCLNLDPGLLSLNKFILATTKDNGHRIPLKDGIYGELSLCFINKGFRPLEWTYPDYKSGEYINILEEIRSIYKKNLKQERGEGRR